MSVKQCNEPFVMVPNSILDDYGLSLEALGLWVRLRRRPKGWKFYKSVLRTELVNVGRDKLDRILKELVTKGMLIINKIRDQQTKKFSYDWNVFDHPNQSVDPHTDFPDPANQAKVGFQPIFEPEPHTGLPDPVNPHLIKLDKEIKQKQEKQEKELKDLVDFDCLEKHTTQAIEMFNRIMGTNGLGDDKLSRTRVMDRLREGYSVDDVVSVIKHKTAEWQSSPKMANFLRLPTLCSPKHFDDYLQAAKQSTPAGAHSMPAPKDHTKQKIRLIQSQINAAKGYVARLKSLCNQKIHGGAIDSQERQIVRWEAEIGQLLAV